MIDIALIREKPEWVKQQIGKLFDPKALERIDAIITLDSQRRALLGELESLQAARNKLNKNVGRLRGDKSLDDATRSARALQAAEAISAGSFDTADQIIAGHSAGWDVVIEEDTNVNEALDTLSEALRGLSDRIGGIEARVKEVEAELHEHMLWVPNMPHESVPVAESEEANTPWPTEGDMPRFDFEPKPHWELGPELGIIDFERGVKMAGTRAYVLVGMGARLQNALAAFYLDMARGKGFTEMYVPFMLLEDMMYGAGQFPKFKDVVYQDSDAGVYMLPTAEIALANFHRDEILDESQLPLYYAAHSPCFRREKMSAGRDVRGIKRVHQFQKVEMFKFCTPETSYDELESLTEAACDIARALKIPFRRLEIVTGDLGFAAAKKWDIEMWGPGCKEWLEVSSCSNDEDFQARRANIKYRPAEGKKTRFVHTLNGSGLAVGRVMIAIMENYQQADGSIIVPEVLRSYMGGVEVIAEA